MMTLAQKVAALTAVVVIDAAMLAFGGAVFAIAALLASFPLSVSIVTR